MQTVVFDTGAARHVSDAFSNGYVKGVPHPDRIMSEHDLVYVTEGEWEIILNGVAHTVEKDDVIILPAGVRHSGNLPCQDGTKTMYTHVGGVKGDVFFDGDEPEVKDAQLALSALIHCRDYPQVKESFEMMVNTFSADIPCKDVRMDALFNLLLANLYDADIKRSNTEKNEFVEGVLRVIHDSPHLFYTNEELAEMFFVCPKTLVNRFRKQTGSSPYQYQMKYKLHSIASLLLKQPNVKLHELAINFGFYDEFHLSRAFKCVYGMAPSDYKKVHTEKQIFLPI